MNTQANRIFISYRRDDAAGYAGRIEDALEARLGRGSVFRDVLDIAPGEDFVAAIRARLAGAQTVLVLIGPRWAGGETPGQRRIDDAGDFVRLEIALALDSGARIVPVLLPGARMPAEADLPVPLKPLAHRNALSLSDTHWDADIARLADSVSPAPRRAIAAWASGGAAIAACAIAALWWLQPRAPADPSAPWVGRWQAEVRYAWGDQQTEHFEFKHHAGQLTGTASFLGYPRAIDTLSIDGNNLHFETHTQQTMGNETREITHHYSVERRGQAPDERLALRLQTRGSFDSNPPLEFEAPASRRGRVGFRRIALMSRPPFAAIGAGQVRSPRRPDLLTMLAGSPHRTTHGAQAGRRPGFQIHRQETTT